MDSVADFIMFSVADLLMDSVADLIMLGVANLVMFSVAGCVCGRVIHSVAPRLSTVTLATMVSNSATSRGQGSSGEEEGEVHHGDWRENVFPPVEGAEAILVSNSTTS